jgi:hypothetical protein
MPPRSPSLEPVIIIVHNDPENVVDLDEIVMKALNVCATCFIDSSLAFEWCVKHPAHADLIITRESMPELSGFRLLKSLDSVLFRPVYSIFLLEPSDNDEHAQEWFQGLDKVFSMVRTLRAVRYPYLMHNLGMALHEAFPWRNNQNCRKKKHIIFGKSFVYAKSTERKIRGTVDQTSEAKECSKNVEPKTIRPISEITATTGLPLFEKNQQEYLQTSLFQETMIISACKGELGYAVETKRNLETVKKNEESTEIVSVSDTEGKTLDTRAGISSSVPNRTNKQIYREYVYLKKVTAIVNLLILGPAFGLFYWGLKSADGFFSLQCIIKFVIGFSIFWYYSHAASYRKKGVFYWLDVWERSILRRWRESEKHDAPSLDQKIPAIMVHT